MKKEYPFRNEIKGEMVDQTGPLNYEVIFLKNEEKDEVYARDNTWSEYYPKTGQFARDRNGKPRYAVSADRALIYPKDENDNEYFLKDGNNDYIYDIKGLRYPVRMNLEKKSREEIYPIQEQIHEGRIERIEIAIPTNQYAKDSDKHHYYPLGFSGNEYYFRGINSPSDYPISHDGFYLAPITAEDDTIFNIPSSNITIKKENILKKIPVYDYNGVLVYHFLTDIKANRKPRSIRSPSVATARPSIQKLPSKTFNISYLCYLIICLIIGFGIMWYWKNI